MCIYCGMVEIMHNAFQLLAFYNDLSLSDHSFILIVTWENSIIARPVCFCVLSQCYSWSVLPVFCGYLLLCSCSMQVCRSWCIDWTPRQLFLVLIILFSQRSKIPLFVIEILFMLLYNCTVARCNYCDVYSSRFLLNLCGKAWDLFWLWDNCTDFREFYFRCLVI